MTLRMTEMGLYAALTIAVLAFGGAAPPFFLPSQLLVFALAILVLCGSLLSLATPRDPRDCHPERNERSAFPSISLGVPRAIPIILIAVVLLQLIPWPAALHIAHDPATGESSGLVSLAPYQTVSHFLVLATYFAAFYLALCVFRNKDAKHRAVYAVLTLGLFEACYGLVQYLTGWQQIFGYVKKYYLEDATGTYINRNHFAGFLEMVLPFAVALAVHFAIDLRRAVLGTERPLHEFFSAKKLPPFVFFVFAATIIFAALIFSRSRMGLISAVASLLVMLVLARSSRRAPRISYSILALIFVAAICLFVWVGSEPVVSRFETLGQEYHLSAQSRLSIWRDTLHLIAHHAILGTGLGSFSVVYPSVQTAFLNLRVEHAHCDYLETVSELGLPASILIFGSILWILARAMQRCRHADESYTAVITLGCVGSIVAILVHSLVDFNLYIPANAFLFVLVLALAGSAVPRAPASSRPDISLAATSHAPKS